jgi:hypothetical protein
MEKGDKSKVGEGGGQSLKGNFYANSSDASINFQFLRRSVGEEEQTKSSMAVFDADAKSRSRRQKVNP